jgi:uncharacterized protein YgbK (DUF1537 family)
MENELNKQLFLCFYGDDFTGSTDSMEALALNGVRTVLFLEPPAPELIEEKFKDIQAFGVAGISRSLGPEEMEKELSPIFQALKTVAAPIIHYKICSTFDSAPNVGSIGKAIDLLSSLYPTNRFLPLLVGAPQLKRYTLFGNHFATVGEETFRLDRHPTMAYHPLTPMSEADLRVHLSKQTSKPIKLINIIELEQEIEGLRKTLEGKLTDQNTPILFDVLNEKDLGKIGHLIWDETQNGSVCVVGSSGVEYALTEYWRKSEMIYKDTISFKDAGPVEQLLVISGSCSPVTKSQIEYAMEQGFIGIKVNPHELLDPEQKDQTFSELLLLVQNYIDNGKSIILYTAFGPDDSSIEATKKGLISKGFSSFETSHLLGQKLGELCKEIVLATGLRRVLIAGGDTSGYVTKQLEIFGLEMIMPVAPGGPLCKGFSNNPAFDGIELSLKGGQVGKEDYFIKIQKGEV